MKLSDEGLPPLAFVQLLERRALDPGAAARLRALAADGLVVPATTRTIAQYHRIELPGSPFRYAVTSNGGNILVDSVPDPDWSAAMNTPLAGGISMTSISSPVRSTSAVSRCDRCEPSLRICGVITPAARAFARSSATIASEISMPCTSTLRSRSGSATRPVPTATG